MHAYEATEGVGEKGEIVFHKRFCYRNVETQKFFGKGGKKFEIKTMENEMKKFVLYLCLRAIPKCLIYLGQIERIRTEFLGRAMKSKKNKEEESFVSQT